MPDRPRQWSSCICPGREPATGPTPRGQQAGTPGQAAEWVTVGRETRLQQVREVHLGILRAQEARPGAFEGMGIDVLHRASPCGSESPRRVADRCGPLTPVLVCVHQNLKCSCSRKFLCFAVCSRVPKTFFGTAQDKANTSTVKNKALVLTKLKPGPLDENTLKVNSMIPTT